MVPRIRAVRTIEGKGAQRSSQQNEWISKGICTNLQTNTQVRYSSCAAREKTMLIKLLFLFRRPNLFVLHFSFCTLSPLMIGPLQLTKWPKIRFTIGDCAGGHRADNREKNRDVLCVPRKCSSFVRCLFSFFFSSQLFKSIAFNEIQSYFHDE